MDPRHVDLYRSLGLDPADETASLRILINGKDAQLESLGVNPQDPRRQQLQIAYAVLGDADNRQQYDAAMLQQRPLSWDDVTYLGNFGSLPHVDPFTPHPQAAAPAMPTYSQQPQSGPYPHPQYQQQGLSPQVYGEGADRASAGIRLGMMLVDGLILSVASLIAAGLFAWAGPLALVASTLVMLFYIIGFETRTGATPAKHMFGYEVRDVETKAKLSIEQSAKRNWWRLVNLVPGIGGLISFIGMIAIGTSIKSETGNRGSHDRWSGTEVVRKN